MGAVCSHRDKASQHHGFFFFFFFLSEYSSAVPDGLVWQ